MRYALGHAYSGLGDWEKSRPSRGWRALELCDDRLVYLVVDHHFFELHEEPAFRGLAGEVGLLDVLQGR